MHRGVIMPLKTQLAQWGKRNHNRIEVALARLSVQRAKPQVVGGGKKSNNIRVDR